MPSGEEITISGNIWAITLPKESYWSRTRGICGILDGDMTDDYTRSDGQVFSPESEEDRNGEYTFKQIHKWGQTWMVTADRFDNLFTDSPDVYNRPLAKVEPVLWTSNALRRNAHGACSTASLRYEFYRDCMIDYGKGLGNSSVTITSE